MLIIYTQNLLLAIRLVAKPTFIDAIQTLKNAFDKKMKLQYEHPSLVIFESELFRTTTTLVLGEGYLLLIDPNWLPREIAFIHAYVERVCGNRTCYLLFTHSDYDHIIGYGKFKGFETIASQNFVSNPKQVDILAEIATFDDQYYIQRDYAIEYPSIDHRIESSSSMKLGIETYEFYQAVGHNSDGLISYNSDRGVLIVGDYLSNIEFPYIYESVAKYKETLEQLERIIENNSVQILITGHGDATHDKNEMLQRLQDSHTYIEQLEASVRNQQAFNEAILWQRYQFPKIMQAFHQANMELLKKELALS